MYKLEEKDRGVKEKTKVMQSVMIAYFITENLLFTVLCFVGSKLLLY